MYKKDTSCHIFICNNLNIRCWFESQPNHQWVVSTHFLFVYNSTLYIHKVSKTQHFRGNKLVIIIRTLYNNIFLFST